MTARASSVLQPLPSLDAPRLRLRPLALDDMDFITRHFSDPDVTRYLLDETPVSGLDPQNACRFGLALKEQGHLIGTCGFHRWDQAHRRAEIGIDLTRSCWGQGLAQEALSALLTFGFERMGLYRVQAFIYVEHTRSLRLFERLGFQREGVLRGYFYLNRSYHDHALYSLLRPDFLRGSS